jgi:hypothetical protein
LVVSRRAAAGEHHGWRYSCHEGMRDSVSGRPLWWSPGAPRVWAGVCGERERRADLRADEHPAKVPEHAHGHGRPAHKRCGLRHRTYGSEVHGEVMPQRWCIEHVGGRGVTVTRQASRQTVSDRRAIHPGGALAWQAMFDAGYVWRLGDPMCGWAWLSKDKAATLGRQKV